MEISPAINDRVLRTTNTVLALDFISNWGSVSTVCLNWENNTLF